MALANHVLRRASRRSRQYQLAQDVVFDSGHKLALDIYGPKTNRVNLPVIILWHGGSWQRGFKHDLDFMGGVLAEAGYIAVIPDYRVAPANPFPAYMHDAAAAFAWMHKHIAEFGGDPQNVFIMGHSAGAQIATLLVARPDFLKPHNVSLDGVRGLIGLAGPYDFIPKGAIKTVFGNADLNTVMPGRIFAQHPPKMPVLLVHGARDFVVEPAQSKKLAAQISADGGIAELHIAPLAEHLLVIAGFAHGGWRLLAPSYKWTTEFIERYRR